MSSVTHRLAFFRQSGWLLIATTLGGVFMWLVHIPAARMPESEYGVFVALLQVLNLMLIPAIGLQTIFAQQTAGAVTSESRQQLAWTVRRLLLGVAGLWAVMALVLFGFRHDILLSLKIVNPFAFWATVGIGLSMLWWPILQGVLQGRQNFLWLGWLQVVNGAVRFGGVVVIVWWFGGWAAGAMTAALLGFWGTVGVAAWHTRGVWRGAGARIDWGGWLRRVVPLTLGLAASQFMLAADQVVVQSTFDSGTGLYGAAGMIGRALVFFTGPLVAVMFPKVVASAARSERTNVLAQALGATALLGGLAAVACTVMPELPLRLIYREYFWVISPLVPWFVWCMLPVTLATVLINNLLARQRYAVVPWLLLIAVSYGIALWWRAQAAQQTEAIQALKMLRLMGETQPLYLGLANAIQGAVLFPAFATVVRTLGFFSLLLLAVAAWFTWRPTPSPRAHRSPSAPIPEIR